MRIMTFLFFILASATAIFPEAASAEDWKKIQDPHGFEVELPAGWSSRVLANGAVVFSPEIETLLGPQAFVWVMHLKEEKTAADLARSLVESYKPVIPDITAEGPRQLNGALTDSCAIRGGFSLLDQKWSYLFVVSAKGKVATLTGFAAPRDRMKDLKIAFTRILAGFRPDGALRNPKRIAPAADQWTTWEDPREKAFTLRVPNGWKVEGGLSRPYVDAGIAISCKKGGKESTALNYVSPMVPAFTEPNPTLAMAGFTEGSAYNPSGGVAQNLIVMRHLGAKGYIEQMLAPEIKKAYPDAVLAWCRERPDFAKVPYKPSYIQTTNQGADCEMDLTVDGVKVKGRAYVLTTRVTIPGGIGLWHAAVGTYCGPPEEFEQAQEIFWRVRDSFVVNPKWAAEEARQVIVRSKIIAAAHEEITRGITQSYETRGRSMDEIGRKWSNAMLGKIDLVDPSTGEIRYGVPSGSNYYWKVGNSLLVGTETHSSPAIGAELQQNLDDLLKP